MNSVTMTIDDDSIIDGVVKIDIGVVAVTDADDEQGLQSYSAITVDTKHVGWKTIGNNG